MPLIFETVHGSENDGDHEDNCTAITYELPENIGYNYFDSLDGLDWGLTNGKKSGGKHGDSSRNDESETEELDGGPDGDEARDGDEAGSDGEEARGSEEAGDGGDDGVYGEYSQQDQEVQ